MGGSKVIRRPPALDMRIYIEVTIDEARDDGRGGARIYWGSGSSSQPSRLNVFSRLPCVSTMTDISQRRKGKGKVVPALNTAIDILNLAKDATSTTPASPVIGAVATLLTMIRVSSLPFRDEMFQAHT